MVTVKLGCTFHFADGNLAKPGTEQPQRATARTLAIQTCSLKAISAPVFMLLSLQPTRHGWFPNRSGNEVLSSLAAADTETQFDHLQGTKAQRGL